MSSCIPTFRAYFDSVRPLGGLTMSSKDVLTLLLCIAIFGIAFIATSGSKPTNNGDLVTPTPTATVVPSPMTTRTPPGDDPEKPTVTPTPPADLPAGPQPSVSSMPVPAPTVTP